MLVYLGLTLDPSIRAENERFAACKNDTSSQCLSSLGVEQAMDARFVPPHMPEVSMLAQMGRIDDAFALALRAESENEPLPEDVEATVNRMLASHRLTGALREGKSLQEAMEMTPGVGAGTLWITALDLLGRRPYGVPARDGSTADAIPRDVVSEIAQRIVDIAQNEPARPRISHLVEAAELHAALGSRDEALKALQSLPRTDDASINPSENLMRLVGPSTFLQLYREAGGTHLSILLTAAAAEPDMTLAATYLEEAFTAFSTKKPFPEYVWMERIIERAVDLGLQPLALELARAFEDRADTEPAIFPVFAHIEAARVLLLAGADEGEVQARLDVALSTFRTKDGKTASDASEIGSIRWGTRRLDAQARREMATLKARLGETETAIAYMAGLEQPLFSWMSMLTSEIPVQDVDLLLLAARGALSDEELAYAKLQHAQQLLLSDTGEGQRVWAQAKATELAQSDMLTGEHAVRVYSMLSRIGALVEDQRLERLGLEQMAEAALKSRRYQDLLMAGFWWNRSQQMP